MDSDNFSDFDEVESFHLEVEMVVSEPIDFECWVQWTFHVVQNVFDTLKNKARIIISL